LRLLWTQPRASVRWLLDHGGMRLSILLVCGASATAVVAWSAAHAPTGVHWVFNLAVGMVLGLLEWILAAAFLMIAGRLFGGVATWRELLVALAWGGAPIAAGLPFALLGLWSRALESPVSIFVADAVLFVLHGWAVATTTLAIAEANRFSFARGVLCTVALLGFFALELSALWFLVPQFAR
jgi:hypothetical protein